MMTAKRRQLLMLRLIEDGVLDLDVLEIESACKPKPARRLAVTSKQPAHFVYVLKCNGLYKIGRSRDPQWRVRQLQTGAAHPIDVVFTIRTRQHGLERALHQRFSSLRKRGEWFELNDAHLDWIRNLQPYVE